LNGSGYRFSAQPEVIVVAEIRSGVRKKYIKALRLSTLIVIELEVVGEELAHAINIAVVVRLPEGAIQREDCTLFTCHLLRGHRVDNGVAQQGNAQHNEFIIHGRGE